MESTPWLTKEAINFLEQVIKCRPDLKILEFGSGGSTIWFAQRTQFLVSIEHNPQWYEKVKKEVLELGFKLVDLRLIEHDYYNVCDEFPDQYFDFILVDGRHRKKCISKGIRILKSGGILMLDDAQRAWYQSINNLLIGWESHKTQEEDSNPNSNTGITQTNWWIKP